MAPQNSSDPYTSKKVKFKKIYFTSRTHSQLTQVVKELKRCPDYLEISGENLPRPETIKISILGSRQHYCVHETVSKFRGGELNENCKKLNTESICGYKKNAKTLARHISPVWDIEDLVETGKEVGACPYFASRDMLGSAHIVFAPYNYLLDPVIRHAMDINLQDAVVIIDEAHNVEDVSREAASFVLTEEDIINTIENLERLISRKALEENKYRHMLQIFQGIQAYIKQVAEIPPKSDGSSLKADGIAAAAILQRHCGISSENLGTLRDYVQAFAKQSADERTSEDALSGSALSTIDGLVTTCEYMIGNELNFLESFKLVIYKEETKRARWKKQNRRGKAKGSMYKFCLWCMNPAVAFEDIAKKTHSIVLASGTLSPLESFATELGVEFKIRLEAKHVINTKKQLWVGAIGHGGNNRTSLKANYMNTKSTGYKDALGDLFLKSISNVPGGF